MTESRIAIYGANGYTGRRTAGALLAAGFDVVLSGRDEKKLRATAEALGDPGHITVHPAPLDDAAALRALARTAAVLIHCAGPFAETGPPVAAATAEAGRHYVDHAVEPHHVKYLFATLGETARRSGSVMVPQASFYGGIPDLLAAAVADGMADVERVTVGYAVSGWRMTPAAKRTAELLISEIDRVTFTDGVQRVGPTDVRTTVFPFPPPLGPRQMLAPFPMGEIVTIPRHVAARTVEAQLTLRTFEEDQVFTSEDATDDERALSTFTIAIQATSRTGGGRNGHVSGVDIWGAGVALGVEAAVRLASGEGPEAPGVYSTAEAFPAMPMLQTLDRLGALTFHGVRESPAK